MRKCLYCLEDTKGLDSDFCSEKHKNLFEKEIKKLKGKPPEMLKLIKSKIDSGITKNYTVKDQLKTWFHKIVSDYKSKRFEKIKEKGFKEFSKKAKEWKKN